MKTVRLNGILKLGLLWPLLSGCGKVAPPDGPIRIDGAGGEPGGTGGNPSNATGGNTAMSCSAGTVYGGPDDATPCPPCGPETWDADPSTDCVPCTKCVPGERVEAEPTTSMD